VRDLRASQFQGHECGTWCPRRRCGPLLVCRPLLKWIPANHFREQQDCGAQLSRSCAFLHRSRRGLGRPRLVCLQPRTVPGPASGPPTHTIRRKILGFWRVLASFELDREPPVGGADRALRRGLRSRVGASMN